jgi:hypothetical protein
MPILRYILSCKGCPFNIKYIVLLKLGLSVKFLETGPELRSNYSEVIAPQDVAVYGALCALASFDRSDLKVHLLFFFFCGTCFVQLH